MLSVTLNTETIKLTTFLNANDEWHSMSLDMYKYNVQLKPYARDLLDVFKNAGIKMAIATANDT